eukprot:scaffold52891_cov57-Phaeocystis_antarctica.AAC.3
MWAAHAANASYPEADWVLVVDSDTFVFEDTVRERVRKLDPSTPAAVGLWLRNRRASIYLSDDLDPNGHAAPLYALRGSVRGRVRGSVRSTAPDACTAGTPVCRRENGDGNFEPNTPRGCCMCPVVQGAGSGGDWADAGGESEGATFAFNRSHGQTYYRPPLDFGHGGIGVLLSRGLLDSIPAQAWRLCARRLVCGSGDLRLSTCIYNLSPQPVKRHYVSERQITKMAEALFRAALNRPDPDAPPPRCPWSVHKLKLRCVRQHGQSPPLGSARAAAPVPPQGEPGGSWQLGTPGKRLVHWTPSHCASGARASRLQSRRFRRR